MARYVRVYPTAYYNWPVLRLELYGGELISQLTLQTINSQHKQKQWTEQGKLASHLTDRN